MSNEIIISDKYPILSFLYAIYVAGEGDTFLNDPLNYEKKYKFSNEAKQLINSIANNSPQLPAEAQIVKLMAMVGAELLATKSPVW